MEYLIVLTPESVAARAHVMPGGMPYWLPSDDAETRIICPTLRCTWIDGSLPSFLRVEMLPDHNGIRNIVWLPTNEVVTIFEPNHNPSVAVNAPTLVH
ncbi:hypothetical protein J2T07_002728 [Luteibacter jiangsuensis]|uniref:Uncharacterized protein n=1 Tax=Luteibacter jiangsuensis TaxID=637577 RepID=A0ABT9T1Z1_9GAMM|nr:hypothetical protein [Luteibacter jiangsuensis]